MRTLILGAIVFSFAIYAWRDWFVSACALVVLAAFMKHADMPRTIGDIPGANPWNLLLVVVVVAWIVTRQRIPASRPCPRYVMVVFGLYVAVLVTAFLRGVMDLGGMRNSLLAGAEVTPGGFTVEYLLNPLKYLVLAALIFDGARANRRNLLLAYGAILAQVLIFVLMTWRYIPLEALLEPAASAHGESAYRRRFQKEIGFHANDIALVLVAGFWAVVASAPLLKVWRWWWKAGAAIGGALTALVVVMTNSRGGYTGFVGVGLLFGLLRYRWILAALPVAVMVALAVFPTLSDRVADGFGVMDASGSRVEDWDAISAGRTTNLWPLAIEEIGGSPIVGQGRMALMRCSIYDRIMAKGNGPPPGHPHNAYLEMLLDSGAVGLIITLLLFVGFPVLAYRRRQLGDPLLTTALYAGLVGAATILIMGITGQTFWPREGVDTILYLYALMLAGSVTMPLPATAEAARYAYSSLDTTFPPAHAARHPKVLRR
jgi:O-antigen ligase